MPIESASDKALLAKLKQLHNAYLDKANEYYDCVQRNEANQFYDDYTQAVADMTADFVDQLRTLIDEFEAQNNHER